MELPSKFLEQIVFNTRPKIEEHILIVIDKSTQENHLSQPLQTNKKHFKKAVTFLTGFNGIFNLTPKNNKTCFMKSITDGNGCIRITIPPGVYEIEALDKEKKRIVIGEGRYTEANYPFEIKPNFSTLGSIVEISPQGPIINRV